MTLCVDIFVVDNFIFLGSIPRRLRYITVTLIENQKHKGVLPVLLQIIALYRAMGFNIEFVLIDREFMVMEVDLLKKRVF